MAWESKGNRRIGWRAWLLSVMFLLLAGSLVFVYLVLPGKVAATIADKARLHQSLTTDPSQDGFAFENVSYPTDDGVTLSGWWMPAKERMPRGTILLSHGVFKNREQVLARAEFLVRGGYQVLLFDHRGHGLSGGSAVSGGLLESEDFPAGVRFLKSRHLLEEPVVYFGFSLGAIAALRAGARGMDVQAVIADSPLPNLRAYVSRRTPAGPLVWMPGFLGLCLSAYDGATGLKLTAGDLDLVPVVKNLKGLPVLYLTGEDDDLARRQDVQRLFNQSASLHPWLVVLPQAGHEQTSSQDPVVYEKVVLDFLTQLKEGFPEAVKWEKDYGGKEKSHSRVK